ncbi:polymer-forming cytoskeletal protein [Paenibacillus sp.]|uniref:bactofilin family protein n=1 Tax=Paenibacillus sp. TaxID=58172 RepID=UPI002D3D40C5|nr:polymer-forming cytoskeletal protein [Paenibacillus sp.]HZG86103.1 polymer-forming cytoskeletal protein [Paenibacillus sp.]
MMFKGKRIDVAATDTLIGEGSVFEGTIKSEASLRIEGRMLGDIECSGDVTVGEGGEAQSNIAARNVVIAGVVRGDVTTRGTLTLTATGKLYGNVRCQSLVVNAGAVFQGASRMDGAGVAETASEQPAAPTGSGAGAGAAAV